MKEITTAYQLALKYSETEHFPSILEFLLHDSLEVFFFIFFLKKKKESTELLPLVIYFIKQFPSFPEVIVQCARKMDPKFWPPIFNHSGTPISLFTVFFLFFFSIFFLEMYGTKTIGCSCIIFANYSSFG